MKPRRFVKALDEAKIVAAIREAEGRSRGEIRVHVASGRVEDAQAAAAAVFDRLGMARTEDRNGVLLFVAPASQTFAVIGDRGINERCAEGLWAEVAASMREEFKEGRYTEGILGAVARMGNELARYFPRSPGVVDRNELPDAVSRD